jgi:phage terminase large subunit-like protein
VLRFTWDQYVDDVLSGREVACRWVRLACERHVRDLETGRERGLYFDEQAAQVVVAFFAVLRHWKGEWAREPVVLAPWQQFVVASLFGWKRADGSRRFRTGYLEVARKNGKTTLAAGIALYLAFVDGEPGAEVYSAATKRDQAKICHKDGTEMVKLSPELRQEIGVFRDNLHQLGTGSKFEPLSADYNTLDGLNVHGAICDELHAWQQRELWGVLKTGMGSRRQPLQFAITTAGVDQQNICYEQREYVTRILQQVMDDDTFWGCIYTLDTKRDWPDLQTADEHENEPDGVIEDDWADEAVWLKANPMLGVSKKWGAMRADAREAANKPAELNMFLRWHLDIWTQAVTRWINPIKWAGCNHMPPGAPGTIRQAGTAALRYLEEYLSGRRCYAGLDLSSNLDITAWVLLFEPEEDEEPYWVLPRFFIPRDNILDRVRKDRVPYDAWERSGMLLTTPGNVIDYDFILAQVDRDAQQYDIEEIGFDRWGASRIMTQLMEKGGDEWVVPIGQGFASMNSPMKQFEELYLGLKLGHGGHPVLTWMADNLVAAEDPAGNMKPDKSKSRERIDGIVALIMATDRAMRRQGGSVYDERELLVI